MSCSSYFWSRKSSEHLAWAPNQPPAIMNTFCTAFIIKLTEAANAGTHINAVFEREILFSFNFAAA